jgi:hypothetical protein
MIPGSHNRHHGRRPKPQPRPDGCHCDPTPHIVATWRHDTLTVALEHTRYCPLPNEAYDPDLYATTGKRQPVQATGGFVRGDYLIGEYGPENIPEYWKTRADS